MRDFLNRASQVRILPGPHCKSPRYRGFLLTRLIEVVSRIFVRARFVPLILSKNSIQTISNLKRVFTFSQSWISLCEKEYSCRLSYLIREISCEGVPLFDPHWWV